MKETLMTTYRGIDYSDGIANIDRETGIRYGVISQNSVSPDAFDDIFNNARDLTHEAAIEEAKRQIAGIENQADLADVLDDLIGRREGYKLVCYEEAEAILIGTVKRIVIQCDEPATLIGADLPLSPENVERIWDAIEQAWNDRYDDCGERDWLYESDGYKLANCLQSDVFVLASPYFTRAQFCSPCVPGACNLDSPCDDGERVYCLGHEWFEDGKAPYPVYSVATRDLVPVPVNA